MVNLEQLRPFHGDFEYALGNFTLCDLNREELSYLAGVLDYVKLSVVLDYVKYNKLKSLVIGSYVEGEEDVGLVGTDCFDGTLFPKKLSSEKVVVFIHRDKIYLIESVVMLGEAHTGTGFFRAESLGYVVSKVANGIFVQSHKHFYSSVPGAYPKYLNLDSNYEYDLLAVCKSLKRFLII